MEADVKRYIRTGVFPQALWKCDIKVVQAFWKLERALSATYIKEWK